MEAPMSTNTDISKLDDLIVTTIDSIRGYEHSAEHTDSAGYQAFFQEMAEEILSLGVIGCSGCCRRARSAAAWACPCLRGRTAR